MARHAEFFHHSPQALEVTLVPDLLHLQNRDAVMRARHATATHARARARHGGNLPFVVVFDLDEHVSLSSL
jgi:hypothetical protein